MKFTIFFLVGITALCSEARPAYLRLSHRPDLPALGSYEASIEVESTTTTPTGKKTTARPRSSATHIIEDEFDIETLDGPINIEEFDEIAASDDLPPFSFEDTAISTGSIVRTTNTSGRRTATFTNGDRTTTSVHGDRTTTSVHGDRTTTASVHGDRTTTTAVHGDRTTTASVHGDRTTTASVHGDTTTSVRGDTTTSVHGDTTTSVRGDTTASVHGDTTTSVHGDTTTSVHGDTTTSVHGDTTTGEVVRKTTAIEDDVVEESILEAPENITEVEAIDQGEVSEAADAEFDEIPAIIKRDAVIKAKWYIRY